MSRHLTPQALEMMRLKRCEPNTYAKIMALRGVRLWRRNLRWAEQYAAGRSVGKPWFKADYCEAMVNMYVSRYRAVE